MTLFDFLLRSSLYFALLYLPYLLLFRRYTFFQWQRVYLVLAALLSLLLPLAGRGGETLALQSYWLQELLVNGQPAVAAAVEQPADWFSLLYFSGLAIASGFFLVRLVRLLLLIGRSRREGEYRLLPRDYPQTAFSFFGIIVLHPGFSEEERRYVLQHERVHVRQGHTWDLFFYEWLCVFAWFNPLYRLARKHLAETHEFIADEQACGGDAVHYQRVLVAHVLGLPAASLTHSFSRPGSLQTRIKMMNKTRSRKASLFGFLLAVPLLAGALTLNSFTFTAKEKTAIVKGDDQAEKMPEFKGGQEALMKYVGENVRYPEDAKKAKTEGMVVVSFVVGKDGKVTKAKVAKSVSPSLDAEALRVVNAMPDWTPGEKSGKKVDAEMSLPIRFKLN